ncbi:MAG: DUF5606 domain-containing protein [Salibacteraceae bacterium]|jgi:hypothetical protein|nr:DUF5606 domain-containing protein [Salibacteraceae bacterium]MDP4964542.1 DUF5606 domain-containing protein [Salibacteraceae bacterium]
MALETILSVSGKPGLYRLVGQMKAGIIVESIEDGKRFPVHGSSKVSALEEISIYTEDEEVPLKEVFKKMYELSEGKQALSHKEDNANIKAFFEKVLPNYDRDRVYVSDMGKVIKWYNSLIEHDAYDPNAEAAAAAEETKEEVQEAEVVEEAPAKKPAAKKTAAKKPAASKSTKKASEE